MRIDLYTFSKLSFSFCAKRKNVNINRNKTLAMVSQHSNQLIHELRYLHVRIQRLKMFEDMV